MKPEFILGNQLRQYRETTQASKWGKITALYRRSIIALTMTAALNGSSFCVSVQ